MRRSRSFAAWLAILAIALQALWPLLAQAKPTSVVLVPVCTVQGVTHYIELPKGSAPVERKAASQHDHCSFCSTGGERLAVRADPAPLLLSAATFTAPLCTQSPSLESSKHLNARSRAPPAASR